MTGMMASYELMVFAMIVRTLLSIRFLEHGSPAKMCQVHAAYCANIRATYARWEDQAWTRNLVLWVPGVIIMALVGQLFPIAALCEVVFQRRRPWWWWWPAQCKQCLRCDAMALQVEAQAALEPTTNESADTPE